MILAQEQAILKGQGEFDQIVAFVRQASGDGSPIHVVERELWRRLRQVGLMMLDGFVKGVGTGDAGPVLAYEGRALRRLAETHDRRYVSIFGELSVSRHVYGTRETRRHEVVPLDARGSSCPTATSRTSCRIGTRT